MRWVCFFSKSGSEILNIIKRSGKIPDLIITNNTKSINKDILKYNVIIKDNNFYSDLLPGDIVTLHGWLRIVPDDICNSFNIYNGHPGDIVQYPCLKGKDPQKKAVDLGLKTSGCIIHKVIPEVDSGDIIYRDVIDISNNLEETISILHDLSTIQWVQFLKDYCE